MDDAFGIALFLMLLVTLPVWLWIRSYRRRRRERRESTERFAELTRRVRALEHGLKTLHSVQARLSLLEEQAAQGKVTAQAAIARPSPAEALLHTPPVVAAASKAEKVEVLPEVKSPGPVATTPRAPSPPAGPARPETYPPPPSEQPAPNFAAVGSSLFEPSKSLLNLEQTLGTNWLNKLGVIILVMGVALFLAYELRALGPAGRILVGYLVGTTMLGAGAFFESRERYRILARAGIGGGWALLFFTTYAMHHVPASRVLASQAVDLVLLLVVAALMVLHTLRYRSQVVTGLAFLLAFSTVTISHVNVYSLFASAILAVGLVMIVVRQRWFELEVFGILASYLNHYFWLRPIIEPMGRHHHPFPEFPASAALLVLYWLVFRASYLVRRIEGASGESVSSAAALLNAFLLLSVMKYQSVHPEWAFWFLLLLGGVEMALGQLPISCRRRTAFVVLSTLGATLLVAAFPFRYSGARLSVLWLMESEAFLFAGVLAREVVFRRLGLAAALVVAGQMLSVDAARVLGARWDSAAAVGEPRVALVFVLAALIFYANAHWVSRRWPDATESPVFRSFFGRLSYVAGLMAFVGVWLMWPEAWTAVTWSALGLVLAYAGQRLRIEKLSTQGNLMAVAAIVRVLAVNLEATRIYHHVTLRLITISIVAALLYLFSRWSGLARIVEGRWIPEAYTWVASTLVALLAWYELRAVSVVLAWVLLGLILFGIGLERRSTSLRLQAYLALAASFLRIFFVNLNAAGNPGEISPRVYTTVPLALACYYVYGRLLRRDDEFLEKDRRIKAAQYHSFLGTLTVAALMRFELAADWVAAAWAALVLILVAVAWRTEQKIFFQQGFVVSFAVLFRAVLHNFYERSYFPAPFWQSRLLCVGSSIGLLLLTLAFALQFELSPQPATGKEQHWLGKAASFPDRHPEQVFFFIPVVLLTWLLALEMRHGLVTLAWGVEAVAVFLLALWAGKRSFRLSALGLLLLCVLKIAVVDVWGLAARDRYVTFIVLGSALLLVSFLYTRYREALREYL